MTSPPQNTREVEYDLFQKTSEQVMESDKFTFVWEITNFSARSEANGEFLKSKEFTINGPGNKSSPVNYMHVFIQEAKLEKAKIIAILFLSFSIMILMMIYSQNLHCTMSN